MIQGKGCVRKWKSPLSLQWFPNFQLSSHTVRFSEQFGPYYIYFETSYMCCLTQKSNFYFIQLSSIVVTKTGLDIGIFSRSHLDLLLVPRLELVPMAGNLFPYHFTVDWIPKELFAACNYRTSQKQCCCCFVEKLEGPVVNANLQTRFDSMSNYIMRNTKHGTRWQFTKKANQKLCLSGYLDVLKLQRSV